MSEVKIEDGVLSTLGVDIKISDIIGEKLVNQWIARLSEDDMNVIFKAIDDEVFENQLYSDRLTFKTRVLVDDRWSTKYEDSPIWKIAKQKITASISEDIAKRVDAIIASEEYQKRASDIANEIVEYATEGYKDDLKKRIYERLVLNTTESMPQYCGQDLRSIIRDEIQNALGNGGY